MQDKKNYPPLLGTLRDKLLRVTCQSQLATQFYQNKPIRARLMLAGDFKIIFSNGGVASCEQKLRMCDTPLQLALQVARTIASNMAYMVF